jgi:8-oxo-dGTP pyrophosphatase MutT (NUDIX family)
VLLQHRDDDPAIMYPGHWGIVGGAGHKDEAPEQIARREVEEETGLRLGRIDAFKAYYFLDPRGDRKGRATKQRADYELYLFHAPCDTPAEQLVCGEGQALRFFAPHELPLLDLAYNHRDVLTEFFASPLYGPYLSGTPFDDAAAGGDEALMGFRAAIAAGDPWFDALMRAIALWERPAETLDGREYRYLAGGEAFDWLLLAERLLAEAPDSVPEAAAERLLFEARPPAPMSHERLRELIGPSKDRARLNYLYGVIVEEALHYAVELDVQKEGRTVSIADGRVDEERADPVFERIYGRTRDALLREFRAERRLPALPHISITELREFVYWLFKFRVAHSEPARVASDTRKALAQLSAIEDAARRRRRQTSGDRQ